MKKVRSSKASISINSSTDLAYSSNENFLPPISASDWSNILLCRFDISSKQEMKMIKNISFLMKNNKKMPKSICKDKAAFFTLNSPY